MSLTAEQASVLEGISPEDLATLVSKANRADTEVRINDEDNQKFGEVSLYKVQSNGYARPKMGIDADGIPGLIAGLQDAFATLRPDQEFDAFALVTEDES
jgi:hypothetical protein